MGYSVKILADSLSTLGARLTTMEVTFPRIVLAEFNTHRMFSRNSASSRAIPVEKRIAAIEADPFIPEAFGRNQKGMQASENLDGEAATMAEVLWRRALENAVHSAKQMAAMGVHKQLANRLIEPFCWHTVIVSATEWDNFWALRCHPDAQPEIRKAAEMMREAYKASTPDIIGNYIEGRHKHSPFHLPLVPDFDELKHSFSIDEICRISIGRCARVSYLTHDGKRDPKADLELCAKLIASGHMSPLEHVAVPALTGGFSGNFRGWVQYRKEIKHEDNFGARNA